MRRNQPQCSPFTWSVATLLTWAAFVSVAESKTITCQVPPVAEDRKATLTCNYGERMFPGSVGKDIIVEHYLSNGTSERIVDCYWKNGASGYTCPTEKAKVQTGIAEDGEHYVTVEFPAKKDKEGKYYCKTTGPGIFSTPCNFTVREPVTCQVPSVKEDELATLTCDYREQIFTGDSHKQISVDHYHENGTPEQIVNCHQMKEASSYICPTEKAKVQTGITEDGEHYVTVEFPAKKNREGLYYCRAPGIASRACQFTILKDCVHPGWRICAIILLCLIILGLLIALAILYYIRYLRCKQVVVSNVIESLISIVCLMKLKKEKLEPERVDDAQLLITKAGIGFAAEMTADLAAVMPRLWRDPKLQDFVRQEAENLQQDSGVYFLNSLDRITAPCYKPTKEDVARAWVKVADAGKTSFTFQALHQRKKDNS